MSLRRNLGQCAAATAALLACSLSPATPRGALLGASLGSLAGEDARVARIGYQLTTANLALCQAPVKTGGFVVQALDQYDQRFRDGAKSTFGLDDHVAVLAIAPGSPAERAGLAVGDRLLAVNARPLPLAAPRPRGGYATVEAALDLIQQAFDRGDATFDVIRDGARRSVTIHPVAGCAVRVQLVPSARLEAFADDRYASVSTAMARFANDDAELAFVVGHELAHGFLRHQALLARNTARASLLAARRPPPRQLVRETERQADQVALYMLARAGFDIAGIPNFLRRFADAQGLGLGFATDHPSSRDRIAAAEAVIADIGHKRAAGEPLMPPGQPGS